MANWLKIENSLNEAARQLENATNAEQYQAIGLICRETLISLAQFVYDEKNHVIPDGVMPSKTDAKRIIEAYLNYEFSGSEYQLTRKWIRVSIDLANELQHKRTGIFKNAALCIEATRTIVKSIGLISGFSLTKSVSPIDLVKQSMPGLINEMQIDLNDNSLIREFFITSKKYMVNIKSPAFIYYFEEHDNLQSKIQILENYGFVVDVTTTNLKKYRMTEEFVNAVITS